MDFEAIIKRSEERKQKAIEFNAKREKYFAHYAERFEVRGYDRRNEFLFNRLTQFCGYYHAGINNKGLFLCAKDSDINTGIGKTLGMEVISSIFKIRIETVVKMADAYVNNRDRFQEMLLSPNYYGSDKLNDLIIDEVGAESITNDYGKKSEVFVDILETRHQEFIKKGSFTHFTSNLTPKEIENRYGHRVWSRINEMATVIEVSGIDSRFN
jgi:DNA replication protein DnaC